MWGYQSNLGKAFSQAVLSFVSSRAIFVFVERPRYCNGCCKTKRTAFTCVFMCKQTHRILIYLGMYGNNLVFGFRLSIDVCAVTCNIWQASLHLFFRSHGDTRECMFFTVLQSKIFERYKIQVEVTSVKHLLRFYMELDGISSTSIISF